MIQKSTFDFLRQLAKNNNREWFEKNRKKYEDALNDMRTFTDSLIGEVSKKDHTLAGNTAREAIMRIFRDVRFSKNKDPYKVNFGASIAKGGKKSKLAGYYVHVEPGGSFIAGGLHMPDAPELQKARQEVFYNADEFRKITGAAGFKKMFGKLWEEDMLKNVPKGYDKDNPDSELVKYKSYMVTATISDEDLSGKDAVKKCAAIFSGMKPLTDFLNRGLE